MGKPTMTAKQCAEESGLTERYFQSAFARGKIAWATQPGGPYTPIIFERDGFEAWFEAGRKHKDRTQWQKSSGATVGRGRARRSRAKIYVTPLEQRIREKLKLASTSGTQN